MDKGFFHEFWEPSQKGLLLLLLLAGDKIKFCLRRRKLVIKWIFLDCYTDINQSNWVIGMRSNSSPCHWPGITLFC